MRKKTWKTNFVKYIHKNINTPFYFGKHDCFLTACDLIKEITGIDAAEQHRNKYEGVEETKKILEKHGGLETEVIKICKQNKWEQINPLFASKGDLVMINIGADRKALGVIDLNGSEILFAAPIGFTRKPITDAVLAWRIT